VTPTKPSINRPGPHHRQHLKADPPPYVVDSNCWARLSAQETQQATRRNWRTTSITARRGRGRSGPRWARARGQTANTTAPDHSQPIPSRSGPSKRGAGGLRAAAGIAITADASGAADHGPLRTGPGAGWWEAGCPAGSESPALATITSKARDQGARRLARRVAAWTMRGPWQLVVEPTKNSTSNQGHLGHLFGPSQTERVLSLPWLHRDWLSRLWCR